MLVAFTAPAWPAAGQAMFNLAGDSAAVHVTSLRDMPFKTVVRQQYDYSCGSAALATLLTHHYGRRTGEAAIFEAMYRSGDREKIRKVGFSLLDMKRYLGSQGLKADGYRWTLEDLQRARAPAIALINVGAYRHFVILKGFRHGKVLVGDPAEGLKLYRLEDFGRIWNGVVFMVDPNAQAPAAYDLAEEWSRLTLGPLDPLDDSTLSSFTRELPPIFQVVALPHGGGAIR
ncbi:C39 family peptidase [Phenylobacterium sp.]|jgi:predicted double-glycine peptidase|uniref:C39 family peptidase n=1 Tax=Phenylobacterium sp. TaxID=1871053 RepID=UPI002F947E69